ncbi:MAG: 3-phosphoshikimate 1-carboxyvinyltransferase [bacterium]|nr:3-phosphoshikimate 1-carboxyvinyltransferase [bacterium]
MKINHPNSSYLIINPTNKLEETITLPGDKSISHRAVMIGALAEGKTEVEGFLEGDDCLNTVKVFQSMGIKIERVDNNLIIYGQGLRGLKKPTDVIDVGNSGTTMRLLLGILAAQRFDSCLTGDESIQRRPMRRVIEPLSQMGAKILAKDGNFAPLEVFGNPNLAPIRYFLPVASAQVKSAILLAGLFASGVTSVIEPLPTRDHTERMLSYFGAQIIKDDMSISIVGDIPLQSNKKIKVPGDISSAAFFIVAACLVEDAEITILNVGVNPTRTGILDVLKEMGANITLENQKMICGELTADIVVKSSRLKGISIRRSMIPRLIDEIPILTVAAGLAEGRTEIREAKELRVKETDRIKSMSTELNKMGAKVMEVEDGLIIDGVKYLVGAEVESYGDHRTAMSLAIAGLVAKGETKINNVACIQTSFPEFTKTLKNVQM